MWSDEGLAAVISFRLVASAGAATTVAVVLLTASGATAGPVGTAPTPVPRCAVERLAQLEGETYSEVVSGSPGGRWLVGLISTDDGGFHGVVWHDGLVTEPDVPLESVTLTGVARGGDVTGSGIESGVSQAFAIVDDTYVALSTPEDATNAYGIAVGKDRVTGAVDSEFGLVPVVWMLDDPTNPITLELPRGYTGYPVGMTRRGKILVAAQDSGFASHAFVFTPSLQRHELARPAGEEELRASAIARGVAATWLPSANTVLLYDLRTYEPVTLTSPLLPEAVNSFGDFAGTDRYDLVAGRHGGGREQDLPALIAGGTGTVTAISESGRLAGNAEREGGAFAAVRWSCG